MESGILLKHADLINLMPTLSSPINIKGREVYLIDWTKNTKKKKKKRTKKERTDKKGKKERPTLACAQDLHTAFFQTLCEETYNSILQFGATFNDLHLLFKVKVVWEIQSSALICLLKLMPDLFCTVYGYEAYFRNFLKRIFFTLACARTLMNCFLSLWA